MKYSKIFLENIHTTKNKKDKISISKTTLKFKISVIPKERALENFEQRGELMLLLFKGLTLGAVLTVECKESNVAIRRGLSNWIECEWLNSSECAANEIH